MKKDILVAGVGGQGILTVAYVLDNASMEAGLYLKQTEVHGMAQRGGGVVSHVRISDKPIHSDMIPQGKADIVLGVEPLEALRYANYLVPNGIIISNTEPFNNIPNYPEIEKVLESIKKYKNILINANELAKEAGSVNAQNVVLIGALSHFLPISCDCIIKWIKNLFEAKGEKFVELNLKAFQTGRESVKL